MIRHNTPDFTAKLIERIEQVRSNVQISNKKFKKLGTRFNDSDLVCEAVIGAVVATHAQKDTTNPLAINTEEAKQIEALAIALDLIPDMVDNGKYDMLIIKILSLMADIDYETQNSLEFH